MRTQKRLHSLSPQDIQPGERNPFYMPRKRPATNTGITTSRVTRSTTQASTTTSEIGEVRPGLVIQGETSTTTMMEILQKVSCGFCGADVSDESIVCTTCSKIYHPTSACTGLKPLSIQCLREEEDSAISYTCTSCRCSPSRVTGSASSNIQGSDGEWKVAVGQVLEIVKSLASNMNALSASVSNVLNNQNAGHQERAEAPTVQSESGISRSDLYAEMWEFEERKKRASSVIVRGIQANNATDYADKFKVVLQFLLGSEPQVSNIYCISADKKIYRVTFSDKATRVNIMNVARNLKDSAEHKHIFISRDLTFSQREELRSKRARRQGRPGIQPNAHRDGESTHTSNQPLTGANSEPVQTNRNRTPEPLPDPGAGEVEGSFL